jgi:acyl-CoA reductase-like NAD-dependent aldehyde dehydrogenase
MRTPVLETFKCVIDGELVGGAYGEVINPADESPVARYVVADAAMIERAVAAAAAAAARWRGTIIPERQRVLAALAEAIESNASELARWLTLEQGKPLAQASDEVAYSVALLRWYAEFGSASDREIFREGNESFERIYTPLGVVAGIVPWNYPLLIAAMKIGPALLAGNSIIVKPAPTTPLVTMAVGRLAVGIAPAGVLQVLGDGGSVGPALVAHRGVQKVSFTGSTLTGRKVLTSGAQTMKRMTLELGGNDPAIVLDDADVVASAAGIYAAAFTNAGQVCGAVKRVYVHRRIYDDFVQELAGLIEKASVGGGLVAGVEVGPLQNKTQFEKAHALLDDARQHGRVVAQAKVASAVGYFIPPTLIADLRDTDRLVVEEQFAPLLPVLRFDEEHDAVSRANGSEYGLTASVWSTDLRRAREVASRLDAALVCINKHNDSPLDGGLSLAKQSGLGWMMGAEGLREYLQAHYLTW